TFGCFVARELQHHDARGLPAAFESARLAAAHDELAAELGDPPRRVLAGFGHQGLGGRLDLDDHVSGHGILLDQPVSIGRLASLDHSCMELSYTETFLWPSRAVSTKASSVAAMPAAAQHHSAR